MRKLIRKLRPRTVWAKVNLALTIVLIVAYGAALHAGDD